MAGLRLEIVIVDPRAVLHFFEMNHVLLLLRDSGLLRLFELEFPEVHNADNGRPRGSRHFDEIQPQLDSLGQSYIDFHDTELTSVGADHANGADPDLPVHPWRSLRRILNRPYSRKRNTKREPLRSPRRKPHTYATTPAVGTYGDTAVDRLQQRTSAGRKSEQEGRRVGPASLPIHFSVFGDVVLAPISA